MNGTIRTGDGEAPPHESQHGPLNGLLAREPVVLTAGVTSLADALEEQAVATRRVDWRPPPDGSAGELAAVLADPRRRAANETAAGRLASARPYLVDVRPATELLGLERGTFLHAGPPIAWPRASGPLRGALIGAVLYEGMAEDPESAKRLLGSGAVTLEPCHHHHAVGPMAGVISPSMWLLRVTDAEHGGTAYASLNEGLGKVLRYGAYGPEVLDRLAWMSRVLGPLLSAAVRSRAAAGTPIDLRAIIAQSLQMGDELHNRNRAATSLLVRELAGDLVGAGFPADDVADVLRFAAGNDHFFLNAGMAAAKVSADAARDVPGSTLVVAMARNGTDFGIQTAGTGDAWFTGPSGVPDGLYLGDYGPGDANPDIGDSTIMETLGVGGFAMAAAPAIVRFVGGEVSDALTATTSMYDITWTEHPAFGVPVLSFRGTPCGIDVTAVVRGHLLPFVNTGIAGRIAGTGQVGAGIVSPPMEAFTGALHGLADRAEPPG